jgi:mannose-6-phosphate isomerase-like protein (cupin superfamily)/heme-degrading monooxygenase HmoA
MKRLFAVILLTNIAITVTAQAVKERIVHNDPSKYRQLSAVHAGAGKMGFTQLIGRNELATNFLYLHAGVIDPQSGIGHHFHHNIEEMYVILNGEAEFTINGHTSKIKAPAVVPCKMGDAHAIYNSSREPLRWLNFAVSLNKGRADNFDLGDSRVGAAIDPIPVFVSARIERNKLKANSLAYASSSVLYQRVFGPDIFRTDWNHVDHVMIPAGSAAGPRQLEGFEEVYYVIKGSGTININNEKTVIKAGDAFFGALGEKITLANDGKEDLELLVIGIAASKQKNLNIAKPMTKPKAMVLQMDFVVQKENAEAFEKMYYSMYVPAMTVQNGYLSSKLLRLYPENVSKEIKAEPTSFNYQIQISFDSEENRRKWVASSQHQIAWPAASGLAKEFKWRGYDVMGDDDQR